MVERIIGVSTVPNCTGFHRDPLHLSTDERSLSSVTAIVHTYEDGRTNVLCPFIDRATCVGKCYYFKYLANEERDRKSIAQSP
jgi:hypothetical protein